MEEPGKRREGGVGWWRERDSERRGCRENRADRENSANSENRENRENCENSESRGGQGLLEGQTAKALERNQP